jgi:hypothetical protein
MDEALAYANQSAGHPVRRGFPPPAIIVPYRIADDVRFFAMSFVAGFLAVYTFIA